MESVLTAAVEGEGRVVPGDLGVDGHGVRGDVGGVAHDDVDPASHGVEAVERPEDVVVVELDGQSAAVDVATRPREGLRGGLDGMDLGAGVLVGHREREAARAGAEVEHAFHRVRVRDQRAGILVGAAAEMVLEQFADE